MEQNAVDNLIVVKRSGQRVPFNGAKVAIAIKKGFDSVYEEYDEKQVNKVYEKVLHYIEKEYKERKTIGVEEIQDIVEDILMDTPFTKEAKASILFGSESPPIKAIQLIPLFFLISFLTSLKVNSVPISSAK